MVSAINCSSIYGRHHFVETHADMSEIVLTATAAAAVEHRQTDLHLAVSILPNQIAQE